MFVLVYCVGSVKLFPPSRDNIPLDHQEPGKNLAGPRCNGQAFVQQPLKLDTHDGYVPLTQYDLAFCTLVNKAWKTVFRSCPLKTLQ